MPLPGRVPSLDVCRVGRHGPRRASYLPGGVGHSSAGSEAAGAWAAESVNLKTSGAVDRSPGGSGPGSRRAGLDQDRGEGPGRPDAAEEAWAE